MDSDSDDDNVHFGTPLEPLEEGSAAKRRPPALEDQTVRDSRGRQRFHGAFTGGFSAGFFNTVGSKDGFQPATFVSSRNTRADRRQARPDDFMDEEDRGEHGIAPQRLQLTAEFRETPTGGIKRKHPQYDEGPIPGEPVLSQLVKPVRDTVGVRILKSMGWRPGQGIGPRVSRKEKKRQRKVYGCARPPGADEPAAAPSGSDSDSDSDSDSALRELLLAPDDYETPLVKPKHDQMGLGYRGLDRRSVLGPTSADATLRYRDKAGKVAIRGQAFGVGAFEEEDDDIYGTEDMSNYDFESAPERPAARPAPSPADRLARTLAGFRLAESARSTRPRYPPPPLPADFVPRHKARASRFEPLPEERRGLERHRLSAGQRADMIGEQRQTPVEVVAGTASSAQSVERTTVAGSTPTAPAPTTTPTPAATVSPAPGTHARFEPSPSTPSVLTSVPPPSSSSHPATTTPIKTEPGVPPPRTEEAERLREIHKVLAEITHSPAVPALKPFVRDPEKQARYEQFLKLSAANRKDDYRLLLPASMTDWEREREISEFHRSALIFRPLAASLASKFVSAGTTEQEKPMEAGSGQAARRDADDPATQAARRKMFGMLTRQTQEWHPAPLLCRRFNVKNPFPHSSVVGTLGPTSGAAASAPISSELVLRPPSPEEQTPPAAPAPKPRLRWDDVMRPDSAESGAATGSGGGDIGSTAPRTMLALPPPSVVGIQPVVAPAQKPPADLFKAIFDDSDTYSESEDAAQAERADSPGTPPPPLVVTASQSAITRDVTPDVKPVVTPSVTDSARAGVTPPVVTLDSAARQGSTPAPLGSGGKSGKSGGPTSRPSAASFFEQPPTAAAKRPGFSLFDNVDLDELNSWRRGSGSRGDGDGGGGSEKKLDTSSASAPAGTGVRGDSPSSDEYGPRLPPAGASASSLSAISRIGRDKDRSDNDSGRWRERSLSKEKKKKKSKKHKKSDKKKKKRKDSVSDSDSSKSDVDMNLFKKLRDVITGKKKKKKKNSSKH